MGGTAERRPSVSKHILGCTTSGPICSILDDPSPLWLVNLPPPPNVLTPPSTDKAFFSGLLTDHWFRWKSRWYVRGVVFFLEKGPFRKETTKNGRELTSWIHCWVEIGKPPENSTPPKANMDTQNDGLEMVAMFHTYVEFLECNCGVIGGCPRFHDMSTKPWWMNSRYLFMGIGWIWNNCYHGCPVIVQVVNLAISEKLKQQKLTVESIQL